MARPRRELLDHRRITLDPGETAAVSFEVPLTALEFWDVRQGGWRLERGPYELLLGASSEDVRLRTTVRLDGPPPRRGGCWSAAFRLPASTSSPAPRSWTGRRRRVTR
ncbi:fibronectin type III-like domain-contianing protein [Streptomyces tricolor]|nr:fibronectin type III-like domain-contianing protein [Streptomyces tricolor]